MQMKQEKKMVEMISKVLFTINMYIHIIQMVGYVVAVFIL